MKRVIPAIALMIWLCPSAGATTLVPATLGDLSKGADIIVRGQVVALQTTWTDDHRAIETLVTLTTDEYLKGQLRPTLQFRVPGGRLGRFQSIMIGAPQFALGDRAVLFLGAHGPSLPYILGLSQGVFRLNGNAGAWLVSPPALLATGQEVPIVRGDRSRRPQALADFEREVRSLVRGGQ